METPLADKRVKREIANSNERRRMQSINAGFQKLKRLLPVNDGEKLSKAAILQHAAEFIQQIERDKLILHEQNTRLRGYIMEVKEGTATIDTIDLDSLQTIPITTHIAINSSTSLITTTTTNSSNNSRITNVNSNTSSSNENSNDDCSKEAHEKVIGYTKIVSNSGNSINKEVNKNDNKEVNKSSDRVTSPNGLVSIGVAKAAIALPLEVPYTSETAIMHHDLHPPPTKMQKTQPTNNTTDSQEPGPKGQNLDTICKAIMEIEGDRVFKNENIK